MSRLESVTVCESAAEVATLAADRIEAAARGATRFHLMLAGGTTPRKAYEILAARALAWRGVELYFGDERCVPPDHEDSNYRMAREALLEPVLRAHGVDLAPRVHRMRAEEPDADGAAAAYAMELPEKIDLLLLGMGQDGHNASLFPGSPAVSEQQRLVVPVVGPKPPPRRLTITPPVFARARAILVLVTGEDKAVMLRAALAAPPAGDGAAHAADRPVVALAKGAHFLVDRAAARLL